MGQAMSARTTTTGQLQSQHSDAHQAATVEDHPRASNTQMPGSSAADGKAPSCQPAPTVQVTGGRTESGKAPSGKHESVEGAAEGIIEQADAAAQETQHPGQVASTSAPERTQAAAKAHALEVGHAVVLPPAAELKHVKADLQELVNAGGGSLDSGWAVQVTLRPSGGRDLLITAPSGSRFRSMKSALESLQPPLPLPHAPPSPKPATGGRKRRKRMPYSPPDSAEGKKFSIDTDGRKRARLAKAAPSAVQPLNGMPAGASAPQDLSRVVLGAVQAGMQMGEEVEDGLDEEESFDLGAAAARYVINKNRQAYMDPEDREGPANSAQSAKMGQDGSAIQGKGAEVRQNGQALEEARQQWKERLKTTVAQGGGALENGWTVHVSPRASGGRDIMIQGTQGERFRSIVQAVEALACSADRRLASPGHQAGWQIMNAVGRTGQNLGAKRDVEAANHWRAKLQEVVDSGGGVLENGWTVTVQRRDNGGRDLSIRGTQGERFRSLSQAADALAGNPVIVRPKQKTGPRLPGGAGASGQPGKRKSAPHSVNLTAVADGSQPGCNGVAGRKEEGGTQTTFTKILARARIQVARLRREEDIINVYEAEGWRGANREKIKPSAELDRARTQISRCKAALREAVKLCEEAEGDKAIPAELYDADGELDEAHIFCARCLDKESFDDNDIVLCDGNCSRAYHEKCTSPPFSAAEMGDRDWLCPACDTKEEILDLLNEEFGFTYDLDTPWNALFADQPASGDMGGSEMGLGDDTWAGFLGSAALAEPDSEDEDFRSSGSERAEGMNDGDDSSDDSDDSGSGSDSSDEEEMVEGKRQRGVVDYLKLNSELFGDAGTDDGEGSDEDWS